MLSNKEYAKRFKGIKNNTWFYILIITYILYWIFNNPNLIHFSFIVTIGLIYVEKTMLFYNGN